MIPTESPRKGSRRLLSGPNLTAMLALAFLGLLPRCPGQGTMTIGFEGPGYTGGPSPQPPGTYVTISGYSESGVTFWNAYNPGNFVLTGPNVSGTPQDGTAYLGVTGGADLTFGLTSGGYFNFVSVDLAGANTSFPGASLEVVGYYPQAVTVTNYITVDSYLDRRANNLPDFETCYLSSQFQHVYRVDVFSVSSDSHYPPWSLDNVVIGGVPEPSTSVLLLIGALCATGYARARRS